MLAIIDWSVAISTIPVTITALAGLIAAIRAGQQAKATRIECATAHARTNVLVADVGDRVATAAEVAASTAADVKAALENPPV